LNTAITSFEVIIILIAFAEKDYLLTATTNKVLKSESIPFTIIRGSIII